MGNAVTDNYYDNVGTVTYWWSHAMISDKTYKQLINTCDFRRQKETDECESLYSYAMDKEFGNIDQYNIYAPPCNNSDGTTTTTITRQSTMHLPHRPRSVCNILYHVLYVDFRIISTLKNVHCYSLGLNYIYTLY